MNSRKKYIIFLILNFLILMTTILFPRPSLILIGTRGQEINLLGFLLMVSVYDLIRSQRRANKLAADKDLTNIEKIVDIVEFLLILLAVYRMQVALGLGV